MKFVIALLIASVSAIKLQQMDSFDLSDDFDAPELADFVELSADLAKEGAKEEKKEEKKEEAKE